MADKSKRLLIMWLSVKYMSTAVDSGRGGEGSARNSEGGSKLTATEQT